KPLFRYDDSLDAFGVHGVGGFLGAVLTGVFASALLVNAGAGNPVEKKVGNLQLDVPKEVAELKVGDLDEKQGDAKNKILGAATKGRTAQITAQVVAAAAAAAYSFFLTLVMVLLIDKVWGFGLTAKEEGEGLDRSAHGEVGFDLSPALEMIPETP